MLVAKEVERVVRRSSWCYEGGKGGLVGGLIWEMGGVGEVSVLRC